MFPLWLCIGLVALPLVVLELMRVPLAAVVSAWKQQVNCVKWGRYTDELAAAGQKEDPEVCP